MRTIIVPLYHYINSKIKLFWNIDQLAKSCRLSFSKHDILGSKILGLDMLKRKLLYLQQNNNKPSCVVIDLKDIESCTIKKQYSSIEAGGLEKRGLHEYIKTISLELGFKNDSSVIGIPLFDNKNDKIQNLPELEAKAKGWETYVSQLLPIKI